MLKLLDGKKSWIVAIAVALGLLYTMLTGQDVSATVEGIVRTLGWGEELTGRLTMFLTELVPMLLAAYAAIDKAIKFIRQKRAGATTAEALSKVGEVKLAIAEGIIAPVVITPPASAVALGPVKLEAIKQVNSDLEKRA